MGRERGRSRRRSRGRVDDACGDRWTEVGRGERVDGLVGVEPARVGHHPQLGVAEPLRLAPSGVALPERLAVGGDPGDGDDPRTVLGDEVRRDASRRRGARRR